MASLPKLNALDYNEPLHDSALKAFVQFDTLTNMRLRDGHETTEPAVDEFEYIPTEEYSCLDFTALKSLQTLRRLRIEMLTLPEAEGLADAVLSLRLHTLGVWAYYNSDKWNQSKMHTGLSPIISFLEHLGGSMTTQSSQRHGFPDTLQELTLQDDCCTSIASLHQLVISTTRHCKYLRKLNLIFLLSDRAQTDIVQLGFPLATHLIYVQSLERLWCDKPILPQHTYFNTTGGLCLTSPMLDSSTDRNKTLANTLDGIIATPSSTEENSACIHIMRYIMNLELEQDAIIVMRTLAHFGHSDFGGKDGECQDMVELVEGFGNMKTK